MEFKERIKELRENKNTKQKEMAEKINIARSSISKLESGILDPSSDILKKLAAYFNVTTDYLLGISNIPKEIKPPLTGYENIVQKIKSKNISPEKLDKLIDIILEKNLLNKILENKPLNQNGIINTSKNHFLCNISIKTFNGMTYEDFMTASGYLSENSTEYDSNKINDIGYADIVAKAKSKNILPDKLDKLIDILHEMWQHL